MMYRFLWRLWWRMPAGSRMERVAEFLARRFG